MSVAHALVVDDDPDFLAGLAELVRREGFEVASAPTLADARARIAKQPPDVLIVDLHMPDGSGLDLRQDLADTSEAEAVLITGSASVETAVLALRGGFSDYVTKPVDFARVKIALANARRTLELRGEIGVLRGHLRRLGRFGPLVGDSPAMQTVYDLIERVARTSARVLISGETGTGKELVAEAIHGLSARAKRPFLAVNCAAVTATLVESELFGHERGSFTGADRVHKGYFERAHGGTLFLDEITEMPLELQSRLLRVLESSSVTRVGATDPIKVDVRILAATSRDPATAIAAGKLREDLFYRLGVFPLPVPPLRDRGDDVRLIAEQFLAELNAAERTRRRFAGGTFERMARYPWPGNVRELRNVVERAYILAADDVVTVDLPVEELAAAPPAVGDEDTVVTRVGTPLAAAERRLVVATLRHFEGDKKKAAEALGISLKTMYNRIAEYGAG